MIFRDLEDAAIEALEPLKNEGLRTLETYAGQLDAGTLEEITIRFPAVYVIVSELDGEPENKADRLSIRLDLIVGEKSLRGSERARYGDDYTPGVYGLLESSGKLLNRLHWKTGWGPLKLARIGPITYAPQSGLCLYGAQYRTIGANVRK